MFYFKNGNCSDNSGGISDLNENGSKNENESESVASIYLNVRHSNVYINMLKIN